MTERYTRIAVDEDLFGTIVQIASQLYEINKNLDRIASVLEEARDAAKEEAEEIMKAAQGAGEVMKN